jgi:hypothetical protein
MSSLNDLIKQRKKGLSGEESLQSDDLAELEQHLRNSVTELRRSGLNDEEAFLVASSRLGNAAALEMEFRKVNGGRVWRRRIFWMLAGYVGLLIFGKLIGGVGSVSSENYGRAAYVGAIGNLVLQIAIPTVCLMVIISRKSGLRPVTLP